MYIFVTFFTLLALGHLQPAAALPTGFFREQMWGAGNSQPMNIEFLPDGRRALILDRRGEVLLLDFQAAPPTAKTVLTISNVNSGDERGCLDIVLDPNFSANSFFYIYYSPTTPEQFRVSRFTYNANTKTVDLSSETIVWRDRDAYIGRYHYGGSLTFGPDDRLYLTTGDKTKAAASQDIFSNAGGVFRFDRNGKAPDDNLGVTFDGRGAVGVEDTLWAYGLRNGFRATWDMPRGAEPRFLIGEVGGNEQAKAWEDLHLGQAGKNFGWPKCEGPCDNPDYARTCSCKEHDNPLYSYRHNGVNAALIGGPVYRGKMFPSELYEGAYFFADYPRKELRYLTFDIKGRVDGSYTFDEDAGQVVSLKVGLEGALWYTTRGGTVHRISYNNGKLEPRIRLARAVTQTVGPAPLIVLFNAYAEDPRGKGLTYTWFFGDGTSLKRANVTRTYARPGMYEAYLVVSDGTESASAAPVRILVGNTPQPIISIPTAGSTFRAGDTINLLGSAEDRDERLKADNLVWTVNFIHDDHAHPVLDRATGFTHSFDIKSDGHPYAGTTGYAITLTATDSDGLSGSITVNIFPEKVNVRFSSVPEGRLVHIDGEPHLLPFVLDTMIGFKHTIEAAEENCRGTDIAYIFTDWSTGEAANMFQLTAPEKDTDVVAVYQGLVCQDAAELPVTDGLVLQLEAGSGLEFAPDGAVQSWASRVGTVVLQAQGRAAGATNPGLAHLALGSRSVLTFDGQSQALIAPTSEGLPQGAEERTLVQLTRVAADSEGWAGFIYGSSKCKQSFGLGADDVKSEDRLVFRGWCGRFNAAPSKGHDSAARLRGAGWRVQSVVYDKNGNLEARVDGATVISTSITLDTAANDDAGAALGRNVDGTGHGKMDVAEVLLFAIALSAKKLAQVEDYLAVKYLSDTPVLLLPNIVIVSPQQGARVDATGLRLRWALEGDATIADALKIQINREPASLATAAAGSLNLGHLNPGEHTVRISLLGSDGQPLTDSAPAFVVFVVPGRPLAKDDTVELPPSDNDGDLTTVINVLSNDERGVMGDEITPTSVEISQPPLYGLVKIDSEGMVRYVPTAAGLLAAPASDAFFYTIADKEGRRSVPAQVTVLYGVHGSRDDEDDGEGKSGPNANFPLSSQLTVHAGIVARLHPGGLVVDIDNVDTSNMSSSEQQGRKHVHGWLDASPYGLDLAAAGDGRPLLMTPERGDIDPLPGHHPYVRFNGISSALARVGVGALPVGISPRTVAMLVRYRSGGKGGFSYGAAGCNRLFGLGVRVGDEDKSTLMVEGWCNSANFLSTTPGKGVGWLVHTAVVDLGSLVMYADRERTLTASHFFNTASESVRLGVNHNYKSHVAMDVAEIIAWDRALTEAEIMSTVTYFESVYLTPGNPPTPLPGTSSLADLNTPDATTTSSAPPNDALSTILGTEAPPSGVNDTLSAGLILRLDAREGVTGGSDGTVSVWKDLSGTGNNLLLHPKSSALPRLYYGDASGLPDGGPAVTFDTGKASMWKRQGLLVPQGQADLTLLALVRYTGPTRTLLGLGGNTCGSGLGIGTGPDRLNSVLWIRTMCDGTSIATEQSGTGVGWLVQVLVVKGGVYSMSVGRKTVASGVAEWDIKGFEISLGSDIGSKNYGGALLAEAYLYERALAPEELAMLVERMQARLQPQPRTPSVTTAAPTLKTTTISTTASASATATSTEDAIRVPSGFVADDQPSGARGVSSGRKLRLFRKRFQSRKGMTKALQRCADMCLNAGRECLAVLLEIKKSDLKYRCTGLHKLAGSKRRRHDSVILQRTSNSLNNGEESSSPLPRSPFSPPARLDADGSYVLLHSSLVAGNITVTKQSRARLAVAYRPTVQAFFQPWHHISGGDVLMAATSACAAMCTAAAICDAFMAVAFAEGLSRGACIGLAGPSTAVLESAVPSVTYTKVSNRTSKGAVKFNGQEDATLGEEKGTVFDAVPMVRYEALPVTGSEVLGLELFALGALAAGGAANGIDGQELVAVVGTRLTVAVRSDAGDASVEVLFDLVWKEDAEAEAAEIMCARGCAATSRCNAFEVMLTRGAEARCRGFAATMKDVGVVSDLAADVLSQGDLALGFIRRNKV